MQRAGYWALIRTNKNYRRLWLSDITSLFGDWFNTIAIYTLVAQLGGSAQALGFVFIAKLLPIALAAPFSGIIVDRFNRKTLMIVSDLSRAAIVLLLLTINSADQLYWVYMIVAAQVVMSSIFLPARSATVPNITSPAELATANALSAATWSVLLTIGAAAGGLATELLGIKAVFIIDSLSYCLSACFIASIAIPRTEPDFDTATDPAHLSPNQTSPHDKESRFFPVYVVRTAINDMALGFRYLKQNLHILRVAIAKAIWAGGVGAIFYMFALLGPMVSPNNPSVAMGLLYSAAGLGTGLGPIIARPWFAEDRWPIITGICIILGGLLYVIFGYLPWTYGVLVIIILAHTAGGANWVMSTVVLQRRTTDHYRGRVFSTELLLFTLANSASIFVASQLLNTDKWEIRTVLVAFACWQIICGSVYLTWSIIGERTYRAQRCSNPTQ